MSTGDIGNMWRQLFITTEKVSLLLVFCEELLGVLLYILEYSGQYPYKKLGVMQNIDRGKGEEPGLDSLSLIKIPRIRR